MYFKNLVVLFPVILSFALFTGCEKSSQINNDNTIYGSGKIISQTRFVDECSGLKIKSVGNVYLTQDNNQSIRIVADDNIIDRVITTSENGNLLVGLKDGSYSNITVKIYVSLKNISNLLIEGAGNINADNDINCESMFCNINGAGSLSLRGESNYFDCSIIGAGNISAKDFITKRCKSYIEGAGNITIFVTEQLDAAVNGVGTIVYYGNPSEVNTSITGLGQIIRK